MHIHINNNNTSGGCDDTSFLTVYPDDGGAQVEEVSMSVYDALVGNKKKEDTSHPALPVKKEKVLRTTSQIKFLEDIEGYDPIERKIFQNLDEDIFELLKSSSINISTLVIFLQNIGLKQSNKIGRNGIKSIVKKYSDSDEIKKISSLFNSSKSNYKFYIYLARKIDHDNFLSLCEEENFEGVNAVLIHSKILKVWRSPSRVTKKQNQCIVGIWKHNYIRLKEIAQLFNDKNNLENFLRICSEKNKRTPKQIIHSFSNAPLEKITKALNKKQK